MRFSIFIFLLSFATLCFAQADSIVSDLDLRIMEPEVDRELYGLNSAKLERKVIDIFTKSGVANRKGSTFAVYPMLSLVEYGKLEGISTDQTVQMELSLLVKNVFSGQDFQVFSRTIKGAGKTRKVAVNRAVSSIRAHKKIYAKFIIELKEKIANYYDAECANISADAKKAIDQKRFEKAVSLLYMLPESSACRASNQVLLDQAYDQFQSQNCEALLQQTEVAMLKKNYKDAIDILGQIDPKSPCQAEAKKLATTLTQKVDEQTSRKMEFLKKVYSDNVEIEKVRQKTMKSISNTYIEGIKKD